MNRRATKLMSILDSHLLFNYATLRKQFPMAKVFRAGAVISHAGRVLMVHHAEIMGRTRVPSRRGFPKGSSESQDASALDTARREVLEETGLDILSRGFTIRPQWIIMPYRTSEIHVYFLVDSRVRPRVKIRDLREIAGYSWYAHGDADSKFAPQLTFSACNILGALGLFFVTFPIFAAYRSAVV